MALGSTLRDAPNAGRFGSTGPGKGSRVDLQRPTAAELDACGRSLGSLAQGATSREEAAGHMVRHFFDSFRSPETGEPACALVRCFQTLPLSSLPAGRKVFAQRRLAPGQDRDDVRCLALLATHGTEPQWNNVADSAEHQAIPLPSVEVILRAPMIARLILQMGIRFEHVVSPPQGEELLLERPGDTLNIFHVARARGSQYIPAQASFVHRYGIRSVLGMGGLSPAGELFATVFFTRVQVSRESAQQFRGLASAMRNLLLRFPSDRVFRSA